MAEFVAEETSCLEMARIAVSTSVTISRFEDLSSPVHGLDVLGIIDNYNPDIHCEH